MSRAPTRDELDTLSRKLNAVLNLAGPPENEATKRWLTVKVTSLIDTFYRRGACLCDDMGLLERDDLVIRIGDDERAHVFIGRKALAKA